MRWLEKRKGPPKTDEDPLVSEVAMLRPALVP